MPNFHSIKPWGKTKIFVIELYNHNFNFVSDHNICAISGELLTSFNLPCSQMKNRMREINDILMNNNIIGQLLDVVQKRKDVWPGHPLSDILMTRWPYFPLFIHYMMQWVNYDLPCIVQLLLPYLQIGKSIKTSVFVLFICLNAIHNIQPPKS